MSRKAKIIATIGPASRDPGKIEALAHAGANVFRLNYSHGTLEEHAKDIKTIRNVSKKLNLALGILVDLPGPKLRTGRLENGRPVFLSPGATVTVTTKQIIGNAKRIHVQYPDLPEKVSVGSAILLADGLLELRVLKIKGSEIQCEIVVGGTLNERKGVNLPGLKLPIPALTEKDEKILKHAVKSGVDFIGLSFVQRPKDVEETRKKLRALGKSLPVIAKIEKPEAVENIEEILLASDGIMIARGDLGVEIPAARVPVVQKELIHLASRTERPVITATQMLESMIQNPRPTRAETTDVANAIWDGSDAVMLSGETATGQYPIETVETMNRIILEAETSPDFQWRNPFQENLSGSDTEAVLRAATEIADPLSHRAIVTYTQTGTTARALSKMRPQVPIFALTPEVETMRRLSLAWGVRPFLSVRGRSVEEMIENGDRMLIEKAGLKPGDRVIMVAGTALSTGATNLLKIHRLGTELASQEKLDLGDGI